MSLLWVPGPSASSHGGKKKPCLFCMQYLCTAAALHYNFTKKNTTETVTTPQYTPKYSKLAIPIFWHLTYICNISSNCSTCTKTALQQLLSILNLASDLHYKTHSYTTEKVTKNLKTSEKPQTYLPKLLQIYYHNYLQFQIQKKIVNQKCNSLLQPIALQFTLQQLA